MSDQQPNPRAWHASFLYTLLAGVAFYVCAVALQWTAGAYGAEFVDDACSHYISGMMVGDYLRQASFQNPVSFLVNFHAHYPLVNIGAWPPLHYFIEGAWSVLFGSSRFAMLLLTALMAAATALVIYRVVARRLGQIAGLFAGLVFIIGPVVQNADTQTMVDVPVAFWCMLALASYERYLARAGARYSLLFGVFAAAAMLTKGNGFCLALMPPLVVFLGRRFDLLRKPSFWSPIPIVALIALPWYAVSYSRSGAGVAQAIIQPGGTSGLPNLPGWQYISKAIPYYSGVLLHSAGPIILGLAMLGFVRLCITGRRSDTLALCAGALFASVCLFMLMPFAFQDRYFIPAVPPMLILASLEGAFLLSYFARFTQSAVARPLLYGALLLTALPAAAQMPHPPHSGMIAAAREIWRDHIASNPVVLVAANNLGECQAISDLAGLDPHAPSLFAVRGTRLLGGGGYSAAEYLPRYATAQEVMDAIDRYAIPFVLLNHVGPWQHLTQVEEAIRLNPERWQLVYRDNSHPPIELYKRIGNDEKKSDARALISLSAPHALGGGAAP